MATLPTKHSTLETLVGGVSVRPDGHDFNYCKIELAWNSDDFIGFTDYVTKVRLSQCGVTVSSVEELLGSESEQTGKDAYRCEFRAEADDEVLIS